MRYKRLRRASVAVPYVDLVGEYCAWIDHCNRLQAFAVSRHPGGADCFRGAAATLDFVPASPDGVKSDPSGINGSGGAPELSPLSPIIPLLTHRLKHSGINEGFDRLRKGIGVRQVAPLG